MYICINNMILIKKKTLWENKYAIFICAANDVYFKLMFWIAYLMLL